MSQHPRGSSISQFVRAAVGPELNGPSDSHLLSQFAAHRDQGAFELLVWRHSAMVLRTCQAVLQDFHAAEDATQATFLALARRAGSVGQRGTVAGWLYRVARRISLRAACRQRSIRVATAEDLNLVATRAHSSDQVADQDLNRLLHDELDRLPDKFRVPLILCFFEGLTQAEVARRLGWPLGTVGTRVARGRERLHRRLLRRGIAAPATGLAALIATDAASALSSSFAGTTAHAALEFAVGSAVPELSKSVLSLANGAIRTMTMQKIRWASTVALICGIVTVGGGLAIGQRTNPGQPAVPVTTPTSPDDAPKPVKPAAGETERKDSASQRRRSLNNLKQITLAIHNYESVNGYLPADVCDKDGKPLLSWRVLLLPYLEQQNLFNLIKLDEPWDSENNKKLLDIVPKIYRVGFENSTDTYYQAFAGPGTPLHPTGDNKHVRFADIVDGTSNTIGVVEAGPPVPWTKPADIPFDPKKPLPKLVGPFSNVLNTAMMDGSAHALRRNIDEKVLRALIGMNDGQVTPSLAELHAPMPAETPEEKEQLGKLIEENEKLVGEIQALLKEHTELMALDAHLKRDPEKAEDLNLHLKQIIEDTRGKNRQMRDNFGLRPGARVPKPSELDK